MSVIRSCLNKGHRFKRIANTNFVSLLFLVMPAKSIMCQTMDAIELNPSGGYIGKQTLDGSGAYLSGCIWSLQVHPGQRISFTFYSFLYGRRQNYKGGYTMIFV